MKKGRLRQKRPKRKRALPHKGVYVRLARSRIHGIGVVAVRDIPKGTLVFGPDDSEMVLIDVSATSGRAPWIKALYKDFCVQNGKKYGCPGNFNDMTVSWYLNHSDHPNVVCRSEYRFVAARPIRHGEELTTDYRTYSANPTPWRGATGPGRTPPHVNTAPASLALKPDHIDDRGRATRRSGQSRTARS